MKKPTVIVLKKNGRILKQWKNNFSSTSFCAGNPLFIIDDEADAASLNTMVNKNKQSTINKSLEDIKENYIQQYLFASYWNSSSNSSSNTAEQMETVLCLLFRTRPRLSWRKFLFLTINYPLVYYLLTMMKQKIYY